MNSLSINDFVCIAKMGLFELVVTLIDCEAEAGRKFPLFELLLKNNQLEIRTCADSLAVLARLITHLASEAEALTTADNASKETTDDSVQMEPIHRRRSSSSTGLSLTTGGSSNVDPATESHLVNMMENAMQDLESQPTIESTEKFRNEKPKKAPKSSKAVHAQSKGENDEEFCVVDVSRGKKTAKVDQREVPGADLNDDIEIVENYYTLPAKRIDPLTTLPDGFMVPLMRYVVRDFNVLWLLYGGEDFGNLPQNRPYSRAGIAHVNIRQRFTEAKQSIYTAGGAGRDHSVLVEILLSKVLRHFLA